MSDFQDRWIEAARDLGIDIALDIDIVLPSTTLLCVPLLVREIGGPKGMVVVHDSGHIEKVRDELVAEGYGYSVMSGDRKSVV